MRQSRPDKQPTEWCLRASTVSPAEPTISAMGGLDPDAPREGTDPSLPWAPLGWPWPFIWRGGWGIRGRQGSSCTLYCALYRTLSSKQLAHVGIERRGPPCVRGVRVSGGIPCAPRCCSRRWRPDGRELNVNVCLTGASVRECDSWTSMESVGASSVQQVREVRRAWTACGAGATKFKWPRWCMQVSRLRSGVMTSLQLQQPGSHSSQLTAHSYLTPEHRRRSTTRPPAYQTACAAVQTACNTAAHSGLTNPPSNDRPDAHLQTPWRAGSGRPPTARSTSRLSAPPPRACTWRRTVAVAEGTSTDAAQGGHAPQPRDIRRDQVQDSAA